MHNYCPLNICTVKTIYHVCTNYLGICILLRFLWSSSFPRNFHPQKFIGKILDCINWRAGHMNSYVWHLQGMMAYFKPTSCSHRFNLESSWHFVEVNYTYQSMYSDGPVLICMWYISWGQVWYIKHKILDWMSVEAKYDNITCATHFGKKYSQFSKGLWSLKISWKYWICDILKIYTPQNFACSYTL